MRGGCGGPAVTTPCPHPVPAGRRTKGRALRGACGAALSAPAAPGFLFQGRDHASGCVPETKRGQSAVQACFKRHHGQWGRGEGTPTLE